MLQYVSITAHAFWAVSVSVAKSIPVGGFKHAEEMEYVDYYEAMLCLFTDILIQTIIKIKAYLNKHLVCSLFSEHLRKANL